MDETQPFRLVETTDTVKITLNHVEGQDVVLWKDIEQAFPGVKRVRNGTSVINFIRSCDSRSPSSALEVVLTTSIEPARLNSSEFDSMDGDENHRMDASVDSPVEDSVVNALDVSQPSKARLFQQIAIRATRKARESQVEHRFISLLPPDAQETVRDSPDIYQAFSEAINDGDGEMSKAELRQDRRFQRLETTMAKNTELLRVTQEEARRLQEKIIENQNEMKQMQRQALGQLSVLQSRVQAVLTQTYELHEYPIPRLFVVLPQDPSRWDPSNIFANKFRLYFLCECGEHTKSINSKNKIPHHIHFAKHEGYEINRPSAFFDEYGRYVLTILKMLKFSVSVAGVVVPAVSQLVKLDTLDKVTTSLQQLRDNIEPGMDHVIEWMDKASINEVEAIDEFAEQMEKKEALEGADLRKLDTFLKDKDSNKALGNLYRTVTDEGHVKWVCIDHYRTNYQENSAKEFQRVLESVGGTFKEDIGRVEANLKSRLLAEQFFSALGKARSVYVLDIDFNWACSTSDLEALEYALKTSRVSILYMDLQLFRTGVASKLLSVSAQYDVIFRIRDLPNMKLLHIDFSSEHIKFVGSPQKQSTHVCKMSYGLVHISSTLGDKEFGMLLEALKTSSTLKTLTLHDSWIGDDGAKALVEALKTNSTLTDLYLWNKIGHGEAKALAEALRTNSTLTTLILSVNDCEGDGVAALAEALKTNTTLTTLELAYNSIGDDGAKALAEALKINSTLTYLGLAYNSIGDDGIETLNEAHKTNSTCNCNTRPQNV